MFFHFETAVYRRFSPPMRRLLVGLAPFETFDAELAKMVSGDSHVNELLSQLLHETSMLLYDNIETYRFWPVFRRVPALGTEAGLHDGAAGRSLPPSGTLL
jgi:LuxR family maltose regulon positive regulatory protein